MSSIVLGGGCFWCLEASYQLVKGVTHVTNGYAGGQTENPNYETVCSGQTGHAEVVKVEFDDSIISLEEIIQIFWVIHDPTTLNQQGNDAGTQYRSVVFYSDDAQKLTAQKSIDAVASLWPEPIVTELTPLTHFYEAETSHQDYFRQHPEQAYCQVVINPKLTKLRKELADKLA